MDNMSIADGWQVTSRLLLIIASYKKGKKGTKSHTQINIHMYICTYCIPGLNKEANPKISTAEVSMTKLIECPIINEQVQNKILLLLTDPWNIPQESAVQFSKSFPLWDSETGKNTPCVQTRCTPLCAVDSIWSSSRAVLHSSAQLVVSKQPLLAGIRV